MTRRSSLRAHAREIYRDLAAKKDATKATEATAGPPSPDAGAVNLIAQNLTEKARALYEDSAVPVAEIARRAGVTERTIYKYAAKQHWTPRYAFTWRCAGAADGSHPRGWRAGKRFAPEKGGGGRFIRRADKDKPFARGLKATDPAGAARAAKGCGEAALLSREAQRQAKNQAEAAQRFDALNHVIEGTSSAFRNLCEFHQRRVKEPPGPFDDRIEDVLTRIVTMSLQQWEALLAEEERDSLNPSP